MRPALAVAESPWPAHLSPTIRKIGADRVRIPAGGTGDVRSEPVLAWLKSRREVVEIDTTPATRALDVRYRDSGGTFAIALRERLFALQRAPEAARGVDVLHEVTGRVRLRLRAIAGADLVRLGAWVGQIPGVHRAFVSPPTATIVVRFDPAVLDASAIVARILASSPDEWPAAPPSAETGLPWGRAAFNSAVFAATASGIVPPPVAAAAVTLTAVPTLRRALTALHERRASIDHLDVAAIALALGTGQAATAAFITWLLGVGDLVLEHSHGRARAAISKLMKLQADDAWRLEDGELVRVAMRDIAVGDRLVVHTGERVPADGTVVSGTASVDEMALTGEAMPRPRAEGEAVFAATVVAEGQIVLEVDRIGNDTIAGKIVQILEGAGAKPMTLQRNAERMADRLVLPTFGIAGLAGALTGQLARATSVLITDFGTGIRIGVPTSALAAMTRAARAGVLIKGGHHLETLAKADVIVFDKTGTLTEGAPRVVAVDTFGSLAQDEVLALAAGAEGKQTHPIAQAIRAHAVGRGIDVPPSELGSESVGVGRGIAARVRGRDVLVGGERWLTQHGVAYEAAGHVAAAHRRRGASSFYVAVDGGVVAVVAYADAPRRESADVVLALKASGRRTIVLLSGDAQDPVDRVARELGVDRAFGGLLPEDKAARVRALREEGKIVAMIGDGINDAPALAVADVGISLHGGTDVALEAADVVLLEGGLAKLPLAFGIADRAMTHVRRGVTFVTVPNVAAIALGALGFITPGAAAILNNGTTVLAGLGALTPLWSRDPAWGA